MTNELIAIGVRGVQATTEMCVEFLAAFVEAVKIADSISVAVAREHVLAGLRLLARSTLGAAVKGQTFFAAVKALAELLPTLSDAERSGILDEEWAPFASGGAKTTNVAMMIRAAHEVPKRPTYLEAELKKLDADVIKHLQLSDLKNWANPQSVRERYRLDMVTTAVAAAKTKCAVHNLYAALANDVPAHASEIFSPDLQQHFTSKAKTVEAAKRHADPIKMRIKWIANKFSPDNIADATPAFFRGHAVTNVPDQERLTAMFKARKVTDAQRSELVKRIVEAAAPVDDAEARSGFSVMMAMMRKTDLNMSEEATKVADLLVKLAPHVVAELSGHHAMMCAVALAYLGLDIDDAKYRAIRSRIKHHTRSDFDPRYRAAVLRRDVTPVNVAAAYTGLSTVYEPHRPHSTKHRANVKWAAFSYYGYYNLHQFSVLHTENDTTHD